MIYIKEKKNGRPKKKKKKKGNYCSYSAAWYCSYCSRLKKMAHQNCTVDEQCNTLCEQWPNTVAA